MADKIIWTQTYFPPDSNKSIFLAGPTPRDAGVSSWRAEAITMLRTLGWKDYIFVPEPPLDTFGFQINQMDDFEYSKQIEWEEEGLTNAKVIMFWIPRQLPHMPAFTTNIEFGMWCKSGKVVLGAPPNAEKMKYLHYYANKLGIPNYTSLEQTAKAAIEMCK